MLELDKDYLLQYGDPLVPLELTRSVGNSQKHPEESFQRFQAPLSLFVQWTMSARDNRSERLYLAQAPLSDLPPRLQEDLPPPKIIWAGKGDIYNANLWMGLAPTYTPLHRDPNPNLFVQLAGTKVVRLFEPDVGQNIFARVQQELGRTASTSIRDEGMMQGEEKRRMHKAVWSDEQSNVDRYGSRAFEVQLQRGDAIFIPKGWWHSIKGIGLGLTASVRYPHDLLHSGNKLMQLNQVNWWFR
ncbi:MAG: RNA recognition motif-containing protein [Watsoniomyces obsoletus]|nr:MAG: RNA recognition motif-containing protein [Watsoniomyces obsoletus]